MLIDWFTVFAQIVNFLILVYLLKRFLYKPILNAIDEREKRIAAQLEDAAKQKSEAQEERLNYEHLNQDLNQKKETLLKDAQTSAESERQRMLDDARKEYANLRKTLKESLASDQANLGNELKQRTQREVFDIARKVLADLAGASLESQMANVFLQKLKALSKDEQTRLLTEFKSATVPVTVSSAFDLPPEQQAAIQQAARDLLGAKTKVQFRTSPDEMCGIELVASGYKIAWTIAEYLDSLEKRITGLADEISSRQPVPTTTKHAK